MLPALTVALSLLVLWPGAASPFHETKAWTLALGAALGVLATLRRPTRWQWSALPLVAVTTLQGGVATIAFAWALATWPALPTAPAWARRVLWWSMAVSAGVVVLQALGVDVLGADVTGRLKTYGTLGNPDFVASALLPLMAVVLAPHPDPLPPRGEREFVGVMVVVALAVTRSFATLLALAAGVLAVRERKVFVPALVCGVVLALPLASRDVRSTVEGRAYLISVAIPHVAEAPVLGLGTGAVERLWPSWELEYWKARCGDAACVEAHPNGRFAGLQDHVHADWLEWLLERGVLGLAALVLALAAPLRAAWKTNRFVFAGLVAALVRSLVDFPLERPADLVVLALLCANARGFSAGPSSTGSDRPG